MSEQFFEQSILNSPYDYPSRYWELDETGQPTYRIIEGRRSAQFITPIPKPKKQKGAAKQHEMVCDDLSSQEHQYDYLASIINKMRHEVDLWCKSPQSEWRVTPETVRLLKHWRYHAFNSYRPFFCQVETVETVIRRTEVAPKLGKRGKVFLDHLANANAEANPGLNRLALKLATGARKTTVMVLLIAWQTVNAVRHPQSKNFIRGFLIVTSTYNLRHTQTVMPRHLIQFLTFINVLFPLSFNILGGSVFAIPTGSAKTPRFLAGFHGKG